jgi:hypothetical protein
MTMFHIFVGVHKFTRNLQFPPIIPYAAPSTGGFVGNSSVGWGRNEPQHDSDHYICWGFTSSPQPTITRHLPYAAPSTGSKGGNRPKGCGRDAARCRRDGKSLPATPVKTEERRKQAASGVPKLWILSFGEAKESISSVGTRTHIKINRRGSDTLNKTIKHRSS